MVRSLFAVALVAFAITGCVYDPNYADYYDDSSLNRGGPYDDPVYRGDGKRRVKGGDYDDRRQYDRRDRYDGRRDGRYDNDRNERPRQRMTIEDAQYQSVNGQRVDASRYVRGECQGENNCDVKASNKIFGDPDVGAHKDLIVRYRCGRGPSRTVRVPEKSERDIKC